MSKRLTLVLAVFFALPLCAPSVARAADTKTPDYVVIHLHEQVNRPADQVWKRIGDYCEISEWMKMTCRYSSGSGDVGTVRVLNDTTLEPMVAKTAMSYTYAQTAGTMADRSYHGTVEVQPDGSGKCIINYTLFYDQSGISTDAERASVHARMATRFQGALDAMKAIAESKP